MDGWVVVGTKLDTKQLERDLKNATRQLEKYEKEAEKLAKVKLKAESDLSAYYEEINLLKQLSSEQLELARNESERQNIITNGQTQLDEIIQKYQTQISNLEEVNTKIKENAKNQELVTNEIEETNQKLSQTKGYENINDAVKNIGKSTNNIIKQIGKWALAIFSIRSAYSLIRSSMSTLTKYNKQLATDLEFITFSIAKALEPIIIRIVNLVYKLMNYINYISIQLTGKPIFSENLAEDFKKANESANKLTKTLAGFDEMNVINDSSTGSSGQTFSPSQDFSGITNNQKEETKSFWDEIFQFWDKDWNDFFSNIGGDWGIFFQGLGLTLKGFFDTFSGTIQALSGLFKILVGIFTGDMDLVEEGWDEMCQGMEKLILGLVEIIGGILLTLVGFFVAIFSEIIGALKILVIEPSIALITALFDTIWSIIKFFFSLLEGIFTSIFFIIAQPFIIATETIINVFTKVGKAITNIVSGIKKLFSGDLTGALKDFKSAFSNIFGALWDIAKAPINLIIGGINSLIKGINKISFDVPDWVPGIGGQKWGFNIPKIPKLAVGGIVNMPGSGVYHNGAMIGERGPEGVVPLTNSQMMAELGEAIGKYITVNANITNTMNGRVISRELQKIKNNNDFAFNR